MAQASSVSFTGNEQKAFDYAETYALLGFQTHVILNLFGEPCMVSIPPLPAIYDIAIRLPEHDAPVPWM